MFYDQKIGINERKVLRVLNRNPNTLFMTSEVARRIGFVNRSLSPVMRRLQRTFKLVVCEKDGHVNYWGIK